MGFFDFFKKNKNNLNNNRVEDKQPLDNNLLLLDELQKLIIEKGHKVEKHPQYTSLTINDDLEIATFIIENPEYHPSLIHLMILTIHKKYFPDGIEENIVGVGINIKEKIKSVLNNYITTTFNPIIESFSDNHDPILDFHKNEILWHPKLGNLSIQGNIEIELKNEQLFSLLIPELKEKISSENKFHWLKIYISKRNDETIIGECLFDNESWNRGLEILENLHKH